LGQGSLIEIGDPTSTGAVTFNDNVLETVTAPYIGANGLGSETTVNDNIYYSLAGAPNLFPGNTSLAAWTSTDTEASGVNPGFANPQAGNFTASNPQYLTQRGINPALFATAGRTSGPAPQADPGLFWDPAPNPQSIPFTANFDTGGGVNDLAGFLLSVASPLQGVAVSSAEAHSAPNSLEFTNGPLGVSWQPMAYRDVYILNGYADISLWLWAQPGSTPWIATRDTVAQLIDGPIVGVGSDGNLYAGNVNTGPCPFGSWIKIEMTFGVGIDLTTTWTCKVTPPSGVTTTYSGIPMPAGFLVFDWFAIASYGSKPAVTSKSFFVDDINVSYSMTAP